MRASNGLCQHRGLNAESNQKGIRSRSRLLLRLWRWSRHFLCLLLLRTTQDYYYYYSYYPGGKKAISAEDAANRLQAASSIDSARSATLPPLQHQLTPLLPSGVSWALSGPAGVFLRRATRRAIWRPTEDRQIDRRGLWLERLRLPAHCSVPASRESADP